MDFWILILTLFPALIGTVYITYSKVQYYRHHEKATKKAQLKRHIWELEEELGIEHLDPYDANTVQTVSHADAILKEVHSSWYDPSDNKIHTQ